MADAMLFQASHEQVPNFLTLVIVLIVIFAFSANSLSVWIPAAVIVIFNRCGSIRTPRSNLSTNQAPFLKISKPVKILA